MQKARQLLTLPLFGAWMRIAVLLVSGMIVLCSGPSAFASGSDHHHADGQFTQAAASAARTVEQRVATGAPIEVSVIAARWPGGCIHPDHKPDHGNSLCCGAACCFAALACNAFGAPTPFAGADIPRLFAQPLVLTDASFGLDRPPDFRG